MMNHNESFNYQIKLIFFKLRQLNLVLSISLLVLIQTGCTAKDEVAPVITNVSLNEETIIVEASDNVEVTGYIIHAFETKPYSITMEDDKWQTENKLVTTEDGTYYVWVKDSSGNISEYHETIDVSLHLAKRFDHLNWLTPAEGTKVVDGVTYNLAELKAEYGDLYRYVEPLTKEEIESRFVYLVNFYEMQKKFRRKDAVATPWEILGGLEIVNEFDPYISEFRDRYFEKLDTTGDDLLSKYRFYFSYSNTTFQYVMVRPESFTSQLGYYGLGTDIIDEVSFSEKDYYVRFFTNEYEKQIQLYKLFNLEPKYAFENWD